MSKPELLEGPAARARYGTTQELFLTRWLELATSDDDWVLNRPFVLLRRLGPWLLMGRPGRAQVRQCVVGPWQEVDGVALRIFDLTQGVAGMQVLTYDFVTDYSREKLEALLFADESAARVAFDDFIHRSERWRGYPRERLLGMLTAKTRELVADQEVAA